MIVSMPRCGVVSGVGILPDRSLSEAEDPVSPAHDRPHRRIGFQRRRIYSHCLAFQQTTIRQHAQQPQENPAVRFHIDTQTTANTKMQSMFQKQNKSLQM